MTRSPEADHRRRLARPWRWLMLAYAVALMAGTHWPNLDLTGEGAPSPDKFLHVLAFSGLTLLVWRTRWVRSRLAVVLMAAAWTVLDEITQALPGLGRQISRQDVVAGMVGVWLVGVGLWATRPVGGPTNRLRVDLQHAALDELFVSPATWAALTVSCLGGAAAGLVIVLISWSAMNWSAPAAMRVGFLLMTGGGFGAALMVLAARWRASLNRIMVRRQCFSCGAPCQSMSDQNFDMCGFAACPRCGTTMRLGQWHDPALLTVARRTVVAPALLALAGGCALVLATVFISLADPRTTWSSLDGSMIVVLVLGAVGAIVAAVARWWRRRLAQAYDRQAQKCRVCGHDLSRTHTQRGVGRCGACSTPFLGERRSTGAALSTEHPAPSTED